MRRWLALAALMVVALTFVVSEPTRAATDEADVDGLSPERIIEDQWRRLPVDDLDASMSQLDPRIRELVPPLDLRRIIFDREGIQWGSVGAALTRFLWSEILVNLTLMGQLIVLGVFCAFLRIIGDNVGGSAGDVAFLVCLLVLLLLGLHAFKEGVTVASDALAQMVIFLQALLPVMSMTLAAVGAVTTAAIFHPLVYATVTGIASLLETVFFPLLFIGATLTVIGAISKDFPLRHVEGALKTGSMAVLGLAFIAFLAVVQTRSLVAPVADGFAIRTAKFLTSTFVPVVGSRVADAMDVIVGGSVLIKNGIGLFGMGVVVLMTAFPVLKILSLWIIFKLSAALIEPVTDPRLVRAMAGLAGGMSLLAAGIITAALMFFVGITVLVSVGNTAATMR